MMAILFQDGFDIYGATSELTRRWAIAGGGISYLPTGGRFGGGAAKCVQRGVYLTTPQIGSPQTVILSFAYKSSNGQTDSSDLIIRFDNELGTLFSIYWLVDTNSWQARSGITTVIGTFDARLREVWHWISIKLTVSDTVGTIDVELDNVSVLSVSGADTHGNVGGTDTVTSIGLGAQNAVNQTWDDVIICDDTGSAPFNDLLSDRRIGTILPDSVGDSADFTASPAVGNYLNVDDTTPDDDTTYVESEVTTNLDLYNMEAVGWSPSTVDAATVVALVSNPDAGVTQCKLMCKSGTTEGAGSAQFATSGYTYLSELFLVNPDTASAWTEATINSIQAGIEIV